MNVLITGGAGYIGSHTAVELENAGIHAILVDNFDNSNQDVIQRIEQILDKKITYYQADCCSESDMSGVFAQHSIDGVIHFAAHKAVGESVANPLKYYSNNLQSLVVMLKCCLQNQVQNFVFSSSCTVYGQPDQVPVTEDTPLKKASSPYGNTKAMGEDILKDTVSAENIRIVSLRYFNPIGAHPSSLIGELPSGVPNNLVPFITQTAAGLREKLTIFGSDYSTPDGTNIRDYIHVVDLAKAHIAAFEFLQTRDEKRFYEVFNVGTGKGNSVLEIVKTFIEQTGVALNYEIGPRRPGDVEQIYGSVDKLEKTTGWKATKTIEESLKDAWNWQKTLKK